jgi:hypothetical protein
VTLAGWWFLLAALVPHDPPGRLEALAVAIVRATPDDAERAMLATISYHETTLGRAGVPFGLSHLQGASLAKRTLGELAGVALRIVRRTRAACGDHPAAQLGFFHHGNGCVPDGYSRLEARTLRRVRAMVAP